MPRNHATAEGGINPTTQPTVIWRTPSSKVQRLRFAFKLSMSIAMTTLPVERGTPWMSGEAPAPDATDTMLRDSLPLHCREISLHILQAVFHFPVASFRRTFTNVDRTETVFSRPSCWYEKVSDPRPQA